MCSGVDWSDTGFFFFEGSAGVWAEQGVSSASVFQYRHCEIICTCNLFLFILVSVKVDPHCGIYLSEFISYDSTKSVKETSDSFWKMFLLHKMQSKICLNCRHIRLVCQCPSISYFFIHFSCHLEICSSGQTSQCVRLLRVYWRTFLIKVELIPEMRLGRLNVVPTAVTELSVC